MATATDPRDLPWGGLLAGATRIEAAAGSCIGNAGRRACPMVLLRGHARLYVVAADGREVTVRYLRTGGLLFLASLLAGSEQVVAEAVGDVTAALLPLEELRRAALENPALAWRLTELVADTAAAVVEALARDQGQPVAARVARHLLELALDTDDGRPVATATHRRLAAASGATREAVTRALGQLSDAGVIGTGQQRIVILDPARLARLAGRRRNASRLASCGLYTPPVCP